MPGMRRREFVTLLGGAAAWPLAARAQQPAMPVIGFLYARSRRCATADCLAAFRQGLKEAGYVEGENVAIEYRWAEDQLRSPAGAGGRSGPPTGGRDRRGRQDCQRRSRPRRQPRRFRSSSASATDPVRLGLVASLARPGGNVTGVNLFNVGADGKAAGAAARAGAQGRSCRRARQSGQCPDYRGHVQRRAGSGARHRAANSMSSTPAPIARSTRPSRPSCASGADALFVGRDPFFTSRRVQLATLARAIGFPRSTASRDYVEAGGLMSYGANLADAYRQVGVYTGRILKGEKPADLPVQQPTKFELVINLKTAKALGLDVPPTLLARADEVIE